MSDKVLTQQSEFLDMLEHGDTVLADRGFTISDDTEPSLRSQISLKEKRSSHKRK